MKATIKQLRSLVRIYYRHFADRGISKEQFRQSIGGPYGDGVIGVETPFGMFIGIETDGYAHT